MNSLRAVVSDDGMGCDKQSTPDAVESLWHCIVMDLEISRKDGRVWALAGVRPDTDQSVVWDNSAGPVDQALRELEGSAAGADS